MSLPIFAAPNPYLAREMAASLSDAADRLDSAADAGSFVAAIEAHRQVWLGICRAAPKLGYLVPAQLMEFSLSAGDRAHGALADHEVETLIHVDRYVAAAITKACPSPP